MSSYGVSGAQNAGGWGAVIWSIKGRVRVLREGGYVLYRFDTRNGGGS